MTIPFSFIRKDQKCRSGLLDFVYCHALLYLVFTYPCFWHISNLWWLFPSSWSWRMPGERDHSPTRCWGSWARTLGWKMMLQNKKNVEFKTWSLFCAFAVAGWPFLLFAHFKGTRTWTSLLDDWEMFVSCFLKCILWRPTHMEMDLEYLSGEEGPGGWSCLSSAGESGVWLC